MSPKKMQVVTLSKTNAVLGVATRRAAGAATVADLAGTGLVARLPDDEAALLVPADELAVTEVAYNDDVIRAPRAYVIDHDDVVAASATLAATTNSNLKVTVNAAVAPPGDKTVLVVIDPGANQPPLKFVGKTVLNVAATDVPVSGVPPGTHLVLASVDGYSVRLDELTFN